MRRYRSWLLGVSAVLGVLGLAVCGVGSAAAVSPAPGFLLHSFAVPTSFSKVNNTRCVETLTSEAPSCDAYQVTAIDGGSSSTGGPVVLSDVLPGEGAGEAPLVNVEGVRLFASASSNRNLGGEDCKVEAKSVRCEYGLPLAPDEALRMIVYFTVKASAPLGAVTNRATVSGGGAPTVSASSANAISEVLPPFGFSVFEAPLVGLGGLPEAQAGGHPYELSTVLGFNNAYEVNGNGFSPSVQDPRDVVVDLPVGLVGSALSTPRLCTFGQLSADDKSPGSTAHCPAESVIGHIKSQPEGSISRIESPLYNMVPERGVAAEFGFTDGVKGTHALYASLVPTPAGYVLRTTSPEIPQAQLDEITAQIFGDPAARDGSSAAGAPTFTNPADCSGEPLVTTTYSDSWEHPGSYNADGTPNLSDPNWVSSTSQSPPVTGCGALAGLFNPTIAATPETTSADSPTGLSVDLAIPQQTGAEALGTPPLRDTVVTLPEGMSVNPSSANGLGACSEAQVGVSSSGEPNATAPECLNSSKIGTVELETPALPAEQCREPIKALQAKTLAECPGEAEREKTPLEGSIYLAKQIENPFGSLLAIYIVIDDARTGVIVKLPAEVKANASTGQLTTVVSNSPQFPFSELRTHFFGGATASLRTPATCGSFTVGSSLTPWSAPESGPPATPSSAFEVSQSTLGSGSCAHSPGAESNSPSFAAGTANATAGAYSPVVVQLSRADGSQGFARLNVTLPPGATGKLAGIPQCSNAQIAAAQARGNPGEGALEAASPSCPAATEVGQVTVGAGAGPKPFYATGHVYLAGPYEGAPFSLAIVTPAIAGPFDLGAVVVRAGLYINPTTAQVTTKSDPIPTILHGIPLDVRSIAVSIDRAGFTLNPTNCNPLSVTGEEISTQGQTAPLSAHFQVAGCKSLKFTPSLTVSTAGRTSKADGASLTVKVAYPANSLGTQANIGRVDLQLPKQLPARLTTLQKACTEVQFNTNPADCPVASDIGTATAVTPLLSSPLTGPAYLVSHGGAAFPDVEFLLQGEGVQITLDGKTQIKKGITYSHFETVPDQPISTFEATFPEGKYSVLSTDIPASAKNSLCGQALTLPTTLTAQNGAVLSQTTKATVTGCPKVKALTRAQQLAKALKACHKKAKGKRKACEKIARKRYAPVKAKKKQKR